MTKKTEIQQASYRIVSYQSRRVVKNVCMEALRRYSVDNKLLSSFESLLTTKVGEGLVSMLVGYAVDKIPTSSAKLVGRELRVNGLFLMGNTLAEEILRAVKKQ